MSSRAKVLSLYRKTLRISRTWQVPTEREYIRNEVRSLVRKNKDIQSNNEVAQKIQEFESRLEIGIHYGIAAPRPTNVEPGATGKDPTVVTPVYLDSYKVKNTSTNVQQRRRSTSAPVYDE